jgi:hypothetical protein
VIDELETRFRRALAHAQENGLDGAVRIWTAMLNWLVENGPALKSRL